MATALFQCPEGSIIARGELGFLIMSFLFLFLNKKGGEINDEKKKEDHPKTARILRSQTGNPLVKKAIKKRNSNQAETFP